MPKVRNARLEFGVVGDALQSIHQIALPAEFHDDAVAQWVLSHDSTFRTQTTERPRDGDDRNRNPQYALARAASAIFQDVIPQYFAALFHIGRVWKVSSSALEEIGLLEQPQQLERTVNTISARPNERRRGTEIDRSEQDSVRATIFAACDDAKSLHRQRLSQAHHWWDLWRREVRPLHEQRMRLDTEYRRGSYDRHGGSSEFYGAIYDTVLLAVVPSRLFASLAADGIELQTGSLDSRQVYGRELLRLLTFYNSQEMGYSHFWDRWLDVQHNQLRMDNQRLLAPRVESALADLRVRNVGTDPFARFDYGGEPASEALVKLYQEHTLPDRSESPWLERWKARTRTLSYEPNVQRNWHTTLDELARTADGEIKKGTCNASQDLQTWNQHVQSQFEIRWVTAVARQVSKTKDGEKAWSIDELEALISAVAERLRSAGYVVEAPTRQRIEKLLSLLRKNAWDVDNRW